MKADPAFAASRSQATPALCPISTVLSPWTIIPPCAVQSPIRAAILPPISTLGSPVLIRSGGDPHTALSPTRAAGRFPISTVGHPAGRIGPPTCVHV